MQEAMRILTMLAVLAMSASSFGQPAPAPKADPELRRLAEWMAGSFDSGKQSQADTNFLDIRLVMMPIWTHRADGYWLYVEQAVATHEDQPYRQRIYHLCRVDDSLLASDVYTLENPLRFAGAWKQSDPLASLTPDSLTKRDGCAIILRPIGDSAFVGGTVGTGCESTLRGAIYATSDVRIKAASLFSWDRGFDADGKQVWGAESGGYIFVKSGSFAVPAVPGAASITKGGLTDADIPDTITTASATATARADRSNTASDAETYNSGGVPNSVFQGGGTRNGDFVPGKHPNALNMERVYCVPPDYWLGDVTNFPGCDSVIPFRACYKDDTNYIKNGKIYPDSIPPLWGGGAVDSIRVVVNSCPADSFLLIKDSSYLLHASVVSYPDGWPHLTDSDIVYWDRGKRGFDSSIVCWDGRCDSTRKIWVTPRKVYLAGTPYNTPHCGGLPNELANVFASADGINFTNRLGTAAGDTIRNPIYFASDYILDTLFYYCEYRGVDSHWTIYDQRICSTGAYRTFEARAVGAAKADPDIFSAADGSLWLVDVVSFVTSQTHVGTGGLDVSMFDILYTSHTTNGLDWSKVSQVTHASPWISPSVILDTGGTYKMWAVASDKRTWGYDSYDPPWGVYMLTAPRPDTFFTQVGECSWDIPFTMAGCDSVKPFHIDVLKRGLDEYIMIGIGAGAVPGYGCVSGRGEAYYIWIAQSFDGLLWHPGNGGYPIYATQYENAWHGQRDTMWDSSIYRASGFWLDDAQTVLRLYYTGWGGTGSSPHISYMDVRFDGNDSSLAVPLWNVPSNPANDDTKLSIDQRLAGIRYLAIDSAISNSADDTVAFYGMMPFDFQSDSVILYYKTSSAMAADIKLDSFWTIVPRYGNLYADSSKPGANLDLASAGLSRVAKAISSKFHSGAEAGICVVVKWGADDGGKTVHFAYVALKGRRI